MIVQAKDFRLGWLNEIKAQKRHNGNPASKRGIRYKDIVTAFDIETTRIKEIEQSVMYIWQWQFGTEYTVIGRTWEEFLSLCHRIRDMMNGQKLVVYVHNLSYEFQFLKGIYSFEPSEVFAIDKRSILKCSMFNCLEFRCSYKHSNMTLKEFTEKMKAEHSKLSGEEFGYDKMRFSWTELTEKELAYAAYDVIGLVEAIMNEMKNDGDNLYTIPLTSTGYVRRDAKRAMRSVSHKYVPDQLANIHVYSMLREAFRGGNTHCNRYFAGQIVNDVSSADRSSSYPDVIVNMKFPTSFFWEVGEQSEEQLRKLIYKREKAVVMRMRFFGLRLKDPKWGCPYLSRDKCRDIVEGWFDNGRILSARYLETTITDIDFRIIESEYEWDFFEAFDVCYTRYGKLPPALVNIINEYYERKTTLKGIEEEELNYFRAKQKLNSVYGMCAQDPVKMPLSFEDGEIIEKSEDPEKLLNESNRKAFLAYQWGVWCTAWARYRLEEGLRLAGHNFVYCDTDSVKYVGDIDWSEYNAERVNDSLDHGSFAEDSKGKKHYMGVFEFEEKYKEFISLGSKKYAYTDQSDKLHITIAGVIKKKGAEEMARHGGIKAFTNGFIFNEAGGLEAVYNDDPEIKEYEIDGHKIKITSNVVLRESSYTLGITDEYDQLINDCQMQAFFSS